MINKIKNIREIIGVVAGRSGGHILPGFTLVNKILEDRQKRVKVLFFSTSSKIDLTLINKNKIEHIEFKLIDFPRFKILKYPMFLFQFSISFFRSLKILFKKKPKKIVSMGGYISVPVCFAAKILRIPIELFELNAVPGLAVKYLSPLADKIHICFESAKSNLPNQKVVFTEYPLRFNVKDRVSKDIACKCLKIKNNKIVILILGGSQGSVFLNELMLKFIKNNKSLKKLHILHQVGFNDIEKIKNFYDKQNISNEVFSFDPELHLHYSAANLVISRAGAGTLHELIFFNKRSIIIPLEADTTSHQIKNAVEIQKIRSDLFTVINQGEIKENPNLFSNCLSKLLEI